MVLENRFGIGDSSRNVLCEPSLIGIASIPAAEISRDTDLGEVLSMSESSLDGTRAR